MFNLTKKAIELLKEIRDIVDGGVLPSRTVMVCVDACIARYHDVVMVSEPTSGPIDKCTYNDCGWCYAPSHINNNSNNGACKAPDECQYFTSSKAKLRLNEHNLQAEKLQNEHNLQAQPTRNRQKLSLSVEKIWNDYNDVCDGVGVFQDSGDALAAAFLSAADQLKTIKTPRDDFEDGFNAGIHAGKLELRSIASELEG